MSAPATSAAGPQDRAQGRLQGLVWWATFLAVGLLAHGPLLLDDGIYFDDWWFLQWLQQGRFEDMLRLQVEQGHPLLAWFIWAFLAFPDPVLGHKLFTFALLVVVAGLTAKICLTAGLTTRRLALVIGLLSLVAPANRALGVFSVTGYVVGCLALFLAAMLLTLRAEPLSGSRRHWRRGVALVCFWISFYLNSLLVLYVALCLVLALRCWRATGPRTLVPWLARHWIFLALPWAFWGLKLLLIHGTRSEDPTYNPLRLWDIEGLVLVYREAFRTYALTARGWLRPSTLLLLGGALGAVTLLRRPFAREPASRRAGARLILWGIGLFLVGLFPYAAVGKGLGPPGAHWAGHYGVLLGLPLALLGAGLLVVIFGGLTRVAWALALTAVGAWSADAVSTHIHWQAEAIKWKAVCRQASRSADVRQANIVAVLDEWPLGMHDTIDGGSVGRVVVTGRFIVRHVRLAPGFFPFFSHFCAPGAPKVAREVFFPALEPEPRPQAALKAAREALNQAMHGGRLERDELRAAYAALDAAAVAGPDAVRAAIAGRWAGILEGLEVIERRHAAMRALRTRVRLRLGGLPEAPAIESKIWDEEVFMWKDPRHLPRGFPVRPRATLVRVGPGPGYAPVYPERPGWWPQARHLWWVYQRERLLGARGAVNSLLDRVAVVEILPLTR